jgi:predicted enzyme related to lactoylglutathione lyase
VDQPDILLLAVIRRSDGEGRPQVAYAVSWFQIPCSDLERGKRFYETILGVALQDLGAPGMKMAAFPADPQKGEVGGAIVAGPGATPSGDGTVVYLNAGPDLQVVLDRVAAAGGKVLMPKTQVPMEGAGYFAVFADSEGNTVGLHSQS